MTSVARLGRQLIQSGAPSDEFLSTGSLELLVGMKAACDTPIRSAPPESATTLVPSPAGKHVARTGRRPAPFPQASGSETLGHDNHEPVERTGMLRRQGRFHTRMDGKDPTQAAAPRRRSCARCRQTCAGHTSCRKMGIGIRCQAWPHFAIVDGRIV